MQNQAVAMPGRRNTPRAVRFAAGSDHELNRTPTTPTRVGTATITKQAAKRTRSPTWGRNTCGASAAIIRPGTEPPSGRVLMLTQSSDELGSGARANPKVSFIE